MSRRCATLLTVALCLTGCTGTEDPLMLAAREGKLDEVRALVEAGADVNVKVHERTGREGTIWYRGSTPVGTAACHGEGKVVKLLVERGADPSATMRANLVTVEPEAAYNRKVEGWTPLLCAAWYGEYASVQALVEAGASLDATDPEGNTAMLHAVGRDDGIIKALLEAGADPNLQNEDGRTALHQAAAANDVKNVQQLVAAGAKLDLTDKKGDTPLDLARSEEVRALLAEANEEEPAADWGPFARPPSWLRLHAAPAKKLLIDHDPSAIEGLELAPERAKFPETKEEAKVREVLASKREEVAFAYPIVVEVDAEIEVLSVKVGATRSTVAEQLHPGDVVFLGARLDLRGGDGLVTAAGWLRDEMSLDLIAKRGEQSSTVTMMLPPDHQFAPTKDAAVAWAPAR